MWLALGFVLPSFEDRQTLMSNYQLERAMFDCVVWNLSRCHAELAHLPCVAITQHSTCDRAASFVVDVAAVEVGATSSNGGHTQGLTCKRAS
jgi:hypothetical protein